MGSKSNTYSFGENTEEYSRRQNKKVGVWISPKFQESRKRAIELITEDKYNLQESDFWILMNETKSGKMGYTGLIISHNGCLKINDHLKEEDKFKPECVSFVKQEGANLVLQYNSSEQGIMEFGEVSSSNCKNEYPYAMVLKRLMDRVILKSSKIAFSGIYSESESTDFKDQTYSTNEDIGVSKQSTTDLFDKLREEIVFCETLDELDLLKSSIPFKQNIQLLKSKDPSLLKALGEIRDQTIERIKGGQDDL